MPRAPDGMRRNIVGRLYNPDKLAAEKAAALGRPGLGRRFQILTRDGFRCQYCGRPAPDVVLHVDHIQPISKGGQNNPENLITACSDCNLGKRDMLLNEVQS